MADSQQKTIEIYQNLMRANATVHAFCAGRRLGLFDALKQGQATAAELASQLDLSARPTELLLNQLCATGFVENYGDDYALSVLGKMLPDIFADLGDGYWKELESWVRTGEKQVAPETPIKATEWAIESNAFEWMSTPNAMDLIEVLNIGKSRIGMQVVDLGCGSGIYGSAIAYHDPEIRMTFVDDEEQLVRARETAASVEITERSRFLSADPKVFAPKSTADLVLISNLCRVLNDRDLELLFQSAARCLNKRGEVAVIDQVSDESHVAFDIKTEAISIEMRTPEGKLRSKTELIELLYANGFCEAMYSDLKSPPGTHGVIVAGKKD